MAKLIKIKSKLLKTDDGEIINPNISKLNQQLSELVPGTYEMIIQRQNTALEVKKNFYFAMESGLAKHIGYRKSELHIVLQLHIGRIVDNKGETVYESIADVKTEERMMERILELQEWAALHFNYKTEPWEDKAHEPPA